MNNFINKLIKMIMLAVFLLPLSLVGAESLIKVPGAPVTMTPPAGFTLAIKFSGFENQQTKSSVSISQFSKNIYPEIFKVYSDLKSAKNVLGKKGVLVSSVKNIKVGAKTITIVKGTEKVGNINIVKYMTLLEGSITAVVVYNVFDPENLTEDKILKSIKSISIGAESTSQAKMNVLPFTFEVYPPFKFQKTLKDNAAVLIIDESQPTIVISNDASIKYNIDNKEVASRKLLLAVENFKNAEVVFVRRIKFAGLDGYKMRAVLNGNMVVQYIGFKENGSVIRLLAVGTINKIRQVGHSIQGVAHSVRLKDMTYLHKP